MRGKLKSEIQWWCRFSLTITFVLLCGSASAADGIQPGAIVQEFSFEDIQGHQSSLGQYANWIQVFTFADRGSSDPLMEWMGPAGMEAIRQNPAVPFARINFADVTAVPGMFEGMVRRILRRIDTDATAELVENYKEADMAYQPELNVFHMIPDWNGEYLARMGLQDAARWHAWVALDGKILHHITEDDADPKQRFVDAINDAVRKRNAGSIQ